MKMALEDRRRRRTHRLYNLASSSMTPGWQMTMELVLGPGYSPILMMLVKLRPPS